MKILLIEDFFHPHAGYNINILSKYFSLYGHEVIIFTSKIDKSPSRLKDFFDVNDIESKDSDFSTRHGIKIHRFKTYFYYSGRAIVSFKLFQSIRMESPDVLFISGNDTFIGILATLIYRQIAIPLVFNSSMVEMASENRFSKLFRIIYRRFISPILIKNDLITIRTQDDPYVTNFLGIPLRLAPFISLGVDMEVFSPVINKDILRIKYGVSIDSFVVIYAGKLDSSKGIQLLIEGFMSPLENIVKTSLIIIGSVHKEHQESFQNFLSTSPNQILHFPTQKYEILSEFYALSDLAVFPRQISLSFFNAQACGLPVVAEFNNVNKERLSHGNGLVFDYGNPSDMIKKIKQIANFKSDEYSLMSQRAVEYVKINFDYHKITFQYLQLFEEEIKKQRKSLA